MFWSCAIVACMLFVGIMSQQFANKVVLVTGGSSGIGKATSLLGAMVYFIARDEHPNWFNGMQTEYVINNDTEVVKSGGRSYFLRADIRNRKQIQTVIQTIHDKFGRLDIAVNNAGISGPLGNLNELDLDQYFFQEHDPIQNNLYGTINCMQEEIKYWISRKDTKSTYSIVNLSSYNGIRGCQGCSLYSASKFGIIGVTKSVAIEFAVATETTPRIRINAVAPGLIETSLTWNQVKFVVNQTQPWIEPYIDRDTFAPYREEFASGLLGKRLGEDFEIASMITYLSSDDASYVSGTVLSVDNAENAK